MDQTRLEDAIVHINALKKEVAGGYAEGLITEYELDNQLSSLQTIYRETLHELGLRDVHARNRETMKRYELDYRAWERGEEPAAAEGEPWLFDCSGQEASPEERATVFALAQHALLEIYAFDFPPDDVEKPRRHLRTYGNGTRVTVPFDCADDDGLATCEDPRGKRFTLTADNGLHATIEVDACAGEDYRPLWKRGTQVRGLIAVEGYTVDGLHSTGAVNFVRGKIDSVSYVNARWLWRDDAHAAAICSAEELAADDSVNIFTQQGERNEAAFRSFPRWQACFDWERAHPPRLLSPSRAEYRATLL